MAEEREVSRKARDMAWREPIEVDEFWGASSAEEGGGAAVPLDD